MIYEFTFENSKNLESFQERTHTTIEKVKRSIIDVNRNYKESVSNLRKHTEENIEALRKKTKEKIVNVNKRISIIESSKNTIVNY